MDQLPENQIADQTMECLSPDVSWTVQEKQDIHVFVKKIVAVALSRGGHPLEIWDIFKQMQDYEPPFFEWVQDALREAAAEHLSEYDRGAVEGAYEMALQCKQHGKR